ncbi:fatty acyl-CoA reductase 1-like [Xylocopa sonorina]|uniref:fatty acyl-CoA reductase 1-like n=1 Tax=Xylocopa sonorina TaxID=1818115 RepID=UPI00403AE5B9
MNEVCESLKLDGKSNSKNNENSQIKRFYAGKVILLTGFTGFLGTIILEKLLRTCTEIGKIYIMIREKKGVKIDERIKKYFENPIFNTLRDANPHFMQKVVPFHGDLIETDLGLSKEDRRCLIENVNIIIHNASMVYFNAKVSKILRTNVIGTQKMLELGLECSRLEAFVYVSTAYSHHYNKTIEENFYPPPVDLKVIKDMIQADEENATGLSQTATNEIVGKWSNLYAFSKATTEGLVETFSRKTSLPCIIYRPSIITLSMEEPIPGWVGNKNGPIHLLTANALGFMHVVPASIDGNIDMIPVDLTANGLLALIWDYVVHRQSKEPQVYNYGSSDWNPFTYRIGYKAFQIAWTEQPPLKMVWYPFGIFVPNYYAFLCLHVLFHVLPAIIVDLILVIWRKKPLAVKMLLLVGKNYDALYRFINGGWIIRTDKLKSIQNYMNAADLKEFPFDLKTVDWFRICSLYEIAIRQFLHDPLETIPAARRKYQKLKASQ